MKINYTIPQIILMIGGIVLASLFLGMAMGKNLTYSHLKYPTVDAYYCADTIANLSQSYMQSIAKATGIDTEKVLQSWEYCAMVMNDTEIIGTIKKCSKNIGGKS